MSNMSTASDGAGLDPEVAQAIESKFEELYDRNKEYIDSEIETFIDKRGVEALVEVADYIEEVEAIQDDVDDLEELLTNVHSIRERVGHFENELERIRAELGGQLDRIEVKLDKLDEETTPTHPLVGVKRAQCVHSTSSTPEKESQRIKGGSMITHERGTEIQHEHYTSPEWVSFSEGNMSVILNPDIHLRYVDDDGKVLYLQHDYEDIPSVGDQVTISDKRYVVTKESHKFNDQDEKEYVTLTVERPTNRFK